MSCPVGRGHRRTAQLWTRGLDCLQLRVCSQSHVFLPVPGVFLHVVPLVSLITFFLSRNQAACHPSGRIAISVIPPVAWSPVLSGDTQEPFAEGAVYCATVVGSTAVRQLLSYVSRRSCDRCLPSTCSTPGAVVEYGGERGDDRDGQEGLPARSVHSRGQAGYDTWDTRVTMVRAWRKETNCGSAGWAVVSGGRRRSH